MTHIFKLAVISTAALLTSCGTIGQPQSIANSIVNDAIELNDAHNATNTAIIFKNILRARDRWPTTFTTLSAVRSDPTLTRGSNITLTPLGLGNPSGPLQGTNSTISNSAKAGVAYSVAPFGAEDGTTTSNVLRAQDAAIFENYFERWPKDVITLLFVNSVETNEGNSISNDGDKIAEFQKNVAKAFGLRGADIERFNLKDHLELKKVGSKPDLTDCITKDRSAFASNKELSEFAASMKSTFDNKISVVKDRNNDVGLQLCKKSESAYRFALKQSDKMRLSSTGNGRKLEFKLRSIREMVHYLGESLRRKQLVVQTGCKLPARRPNGQIIYDGAGRMVIQRQMGPLFETRTDYDKLSVDYAARLNHSGQIYYAIPNNSDVEALGYCLNDRSGMSMSVLNQLLMINQSPEALKSPQLFFDR